jgi:hypothetical protein
MFRITRAASCLAACLAVLAAGRPHASAVDERSPRVAIAEIAAQVDRSLVHLEVPDGYGTGFLFRDPRTIVTAAHVLGAVPVGGEVVVRTVAEDDEGAAVLAVAAPALLRQVHPEIDLAVLEWTQPNEGATPLEAVSMRRLLPRGTEVLVHGFPGTMAPTLARGIVSAHQFGFADGHTSYLLDAALGSGGSGGPVTDLAGRLIGVANAVYDDGEPSNFNWAYAIPLRHVESMVPLGGVSAMPKPRTLEERIAAVQSAKGFEAQVSARQREVAELAATAASLAALRADVAALLGAIGPMPTPSNAAEAGRAEEATIRVTRALAERAVVLSWREIPADELEAYEMWRDGSAHDPAWVCEVAFDFGPEIDPSASEARARFISLLATRLRISADDARDGCTQVSAYVVCPPFEERLLDRAAVIAGYASIDLLSCRLDEAWMAMEILGEDGPPDDLVEARAFDRLARATEAAQAVWFSLPPACRDVRSELDELDLDTLRELLEAAGYRRVDRVRVDVEAASSGDPNPTVVFSLEALGSPTAVYALAVVNGDDSEQLDIDIDLALFDRTGYPVDSDERGEAFAVVAAASDDPGPWRLEVINAKESPQTVRIEFWAKPGTVKLLREGE